MWSIKFCGGLWHCMITGLHQEWIRQNLYTSCMVAWSRVVVTAHYFFMINNSRSYLASLCCFIFCLHILWGASLRQRECWGYHYITTSSRLTHHCYNRYQWWQSHCRLNRPTRSTMITWERSQLEPLIVEAILLFVGSLIWKSSAAWSLQGTGLLSDLRC